MRRRPSSLQQTPSTFERPHPAPLPIKHDRVLEDVGGAGGADFRGVVAVPELGDGLAEAALDGVAEFGLHD
jgi:hypothetical protein